MPSPTTLTTGPQSLLTPADPARRSAWAQLGTSVAGAGSAHEALVTAGLAGWNIRKVPMTGTEITPDGVTTIGNPDKVMLVRTDPRTKATRYLSTVGTKYGVHQNEAGSAVIDTLVAESGARGTGYAGSIEGGRKTFVTIELPSTMHVDGTDVLQLHLVVFNSHDGETAFRVMLVPFRPFCANQQNVAIRDHVSCVSIRHTSKSEITVEEIRSKLGLLYDYSSAFEAEAQRMIRTEMTRAEFEDLIPQVWPVKDNAQARAVNNARRRTGDLIRLWASARTQAPIRGTRWAAFQAVTEYLDHYVPAKDLGVRANRVLAGDDLAKRKQTAYNLLST
jgi:phage/plasmid-like protein (TIGR03299 family)